MIYHSMRCQREALRSDRRDVQAVLSRDLTLARALALFTGHGDLPTMDAISQGAVCLSEALLDDLEPSSNPHLRARKLGSYLGSCCQVGALAAGLSAGGQRLAVAYGHLLMDPQAPTWEPNGHLPPIGDSPEASACFHALQTLAAVGA
jgi:geranylgeranyl pyrophosphate synthase